MPVAIDQVLIGRNACYRITKALKDASVFQARLMPRIPDDPNDSAIFPTKLAVVKHQPKKDYRIVYDRERRCNEIPSIAQSPYFRAMQDLIGHEEDPGVNESESQPQCMVFEWMDTDLWQLPSEPFRSGSKLPKVVSKSVLEALSVLHDLKGVHTDLNPNNVFVSGSRELHPVVKLGDLGNTIPEGNSRQYRCQGLEIRAPEVWRGVGIFHSSDIWSLGVTLAHWLASKVLFGPSEKIIQDMTDAWCLAKIIRLVGPLQDPVKPEYGEEFAAAEILEQETFSHPATGMTEEFIKLGKIRQELEAVPGKKIDEDCISFIESLLIMDHTKRPTAREALKHPWLQNIDGNDVD